jgi:hypothetical protein
MKNNDWILGILPLMILVAGMLTPIVYNHDLYKNDHPNSLSDR